MENKPTATPPSFDLPDTSEKSVGWAAWDGAMRGFGSLIIIPIVLIGGIKLFGHSKPYKELLIDQFSGTLGKVQIGLTAVSTALGAYFGMGEARKHNQLVAENNLMRVELTQTSQVLNQVADNLAQQRDALTAKIEARTRGSAIAPAASHAEAIQAEKLAAMDASPTIH